MMKKAAFFLAAALFLFSSPVLALKVPAPAGDIYVQDFAGVLTESEEARLKQLGRQLEDGTTAQVAVLTISSLEGETIESFANKAYREYGIGSIQENNGVLIVVSMDDHKIRAEIGYGLEGALPDGKVGRILSEYGIPYLKAGQPNEAIIQTYTSFYNETAAEYNWDGPPADAVPYQKEDPGIGIHPVFLAVIAVLVVILDMKFFGGILTHIFLSMLSRGGGRGGGGPRGGGGGSSGGGGASRGW